MKYTLPLLALLFSAAEALPATELLPSVEVLPRAETCPSVTFIHAAWSPDHIVYNHAKTKQLLNDFKGEKRVLSLCEILTFVPPGMGIGIGCWISKTFIAEEMVDLTEKCIEDKKCLRMRNGIAPDCYTGKGCC